MIKYHYDFSNNKWFNKIRNFDIAKYNCVSMDTYILEQCTMARSQCNDLLIADCSGACRVDYQRRRPAIWGFGMRASLYEFMIVTTPETCTNNRTGRTKLMRMIIYIYNHAHQFYIYISMRTNWHHMTPNILLCRCPQKQKQRGSRLYAPESYNEIIFGSALVQILTCCLKIPNC